MKVVIIDSNHCHIDSVALTPRKYKYLARVRIAVQ